METMKKVYGYVRVSSDDQKNSFDIQKPMIEKFAMANDWSLVDIFADEQVSGGKHISKRPEGKKMCEGLNNGDASIVICTKIDRLFRDVKDALITVDHWHDIDVSFAMTDGYGNSFNTQTAMGRNMFIDAVKYAEFERRITGERTSLILSDKKDKKLPYTKYLYGFDVANREVTPEGKVVKSGVLVPNEKEQKVLTIIFNLRKNGMAYNKIAGKLNYSDIPAKAGGKWYPSVIQYICENEIYNSTASLPV